MSALGEQQIVKFPLNLPELWLGILSVPIRESTQITADPEGCFADIWVRFSVILHRWNDCKVTGCTLHREASFLLSDIAEAPRLSLVRVSGFSLCTFFSMLTCLLIYLGVCLLCCTYSFSKQPYAKEKSYSSILQSIFSCCPTGEYPPSAPSKYSNLECATAVLKKKLHGQRRQSFTLTDKSNRARAISFFTHFCLFLPETVSGSPWVSTFQKGTQMHWSIFKLLQSVCAQMLKKSSGFKHLVCNVSAVPRNQLICCIRTGVFD